MPESSGAYLQKVVNDSVSVAEAEERNGGPICIACFAAAEGGSCCATGTLQIHFAESHEERDMGAYYFAQEFLGINFAHATRIFAWASYYDKPSLSDVTRADVLAELDRLIAVCPSE